MFQSAMTGGGFGAMGDDPIDDYGMDGAHLPPAPLALSALCDTGAEHALTAREIGPPSADFDGYPMHGGGPGGEKVKEIPLDFFNGAWPPCIVPLHSASQLRPSPGAAFARGGAWPCSTGLGQHSR
jgi:hypothetical protein